MNIEHVHGRCSKPDIGAQTTTGFAPRRRNIVVAIDVDRRPAQNDVAVATAFQPPVFAKNEIETEFIRNEPCLVFDRIGVFDAQNFLERDDVGIDLLQDLDDSLRSSPPIHSPAFMNVVCDDSQGRSIF